MLRELRQIWDDTKIYFVAFAGVLVVFTVLKTAEQILVCNPAARSKCEQLRDAGVNAVLVEYGITDECVVPTSHHGGR